MINIGFRVTTVTIWKRKETNFEELGGSEVMI